MLNRIVSGIMFALLLTGMLTLAFTTQPVVASETIYIRADGTVEGTDKIQRDVDVYSFTDNINDAIVVERSDIIIDGKGFTLNGSGSGNGVYLSGMNNVTIQNTNIKNFYKGVYFYSSSDSTVSGNNITNGETGLHIGIYIYDSPSNDISKNNVRNNYYGICLEHSSSNILSYNNVSNKREPERAGNGICLFYSSNNTLYSNIVSSNNDYGIYLESSSNNTISRNDLSDNRGGIYLGSLGSNIIFHNNFINSTECHVSLHQSFNNIWDDGYPSGGNYWSDYGGVDLYSGSYQNETGSDRIGDTQYVIDENNTDYYPLMHPYGSVRNLDTSLTYLTIQSAIDAPETLNGHTILVDAGTFAENVSVYKQLSVIGAGFEVTIVEFDAGHPHNPIFYVTADHVTISGFTIESPTKGIGIKIRDADHVTVTNNRLLGLSYGVEVGGSGDYINISSNKLTENDYGILFLQTGHLYSNNTVADNDIVSYGQWTNEGINAYELFRSTISNNNLSLGQNLLGGICLAESSSCNLIEGNTVKGATYGIHLQTWNNMASNNNTITKNLVENNSYGICIDVFASDPNKPSNNTVYHNNFINNTVSAYSVSGAINAWDDGYPSGGNYWSDYTGVDLYSGPYQNETGNDAIGDTAYVMDANNTDYYPLIHPYGSVRNLDTSLTYLTIQSAIDAPETLNGHTIFVEKGTYYEHVVVYKSLSLVGADKFNTIIDGNLTGNVMNITANNVKITGFTIQNSGTVSPNSAIYVVSSNGTNISYNIIRNNSLYGIHIRSSSNNTVSGNIATNNHFGVNLWSSFNNTVSGNTITHIGCFGVSVDQGSSRNTVSDNNITNNAYGVIIQHSSANNTITRNNITDNSYGVRLLLWANNNTVSKNDVTNNTYGVSFHYSVSNTFYHNNFINNTKQVHFTYSSYANFWDYGYPYGGNYWSNYAGVDLCSGRYQNESDSDGIGDTQHGIDENNTDRYPLMGPFGPLTMKGHNVTVIPTEEITLIFEEVIEAGLTEATEKDVPEKALEELKDRKSILAEEAEKCIDIKTTAKIAEEKKTKIIKRYKKKALKKKIVERDLRLVKWNETAEEWIDVTKRVDTIAHMIKAETISRSIFAVVVPVHDINVTNVATSKTVVGQGFTLRINATVANQGGRPETFNVTAYANTTIIATFDNITLANGTSTTLTFVWNTTGLAKGNYTISANATIVPGETDTEDNSLTDEWAIVAMLGDITGPEGYPDGKCDIKDVAMIARLYGVNYPDPRYDPNCDLTGPTPGVADGKIDIKDVALVAKHYGEIDP